MWMLQCRDMMMENKKKFRSKMCTSTFYQKFSWSMPLLNNFFQDSKISVVNKNKSIKYLPVDNSDSDSDSDSVVESLILIDKQCEFKNKVNFMMLNRNNTRRNYSSNFDIGQQESDLMTKNTRRNWRKLFAGGLIALVVLLLLIATLFLVKLNPDEGNSQTTTTSSITLDEWLWGSLSTKNFNGTWINDDEILYRDESDNLMIYNIENDVSKVLLPMTNPVLSSSFDYVLSPDKKYLLLASNYQKFYRHTYLAQYKIVNLATFNETSLSVGNSTTPATLQLATWGPKGNAIIYVYLSNIYYRPEAEIPIDYQITTTGDYGSIYNAVPDWVYEEEVFSSNKALWFSPSGKKMAFGFFNDTKSHLMTIPYYGYPGSLSFQYPSAIPVHYPKSGTVNPTVKLFYIDLEMVSSSRGNNISLVEIQHPPQLSGKERILAAVTFPTENIISATWMNRVQNQAYFQLYNIEKSSYNTALEYIERNGWVEQFEAPHFSKDGKKFLLILPQKQSDHDHWPHLVMVTNMNNNSRTIRALTSGTFVVTEISGWDEENSLVYYLATVDDDPAQQHLYRVSTLDENSKPECLSCNVKSENGEKLCLYNEAKLSPSGNRFILTCAGPDVPDVSIYNSDNSTKLLTWESNSRVANVIKEKSRPIVKRFTVRVPGDFDAQVRLLIPPGADLTGAKKYPMLVYVYGGPDSYQVTEKFNVDWGTYLSTNKNIIYAAIDGRGSGLKGNAMLFSGYRNLGTVEIYDQINVTRHIQMNYPFVDKEKTAIWGWSYGGYATGMSLAMDKENVFKCGMSVAPVTDWALYDSIYTERFMGLPTVADNLGGYEQGQLLNKVDNIKSNSYYLIHGTLDDNVHYQQSLLLAKVLEQKDILFRQQTYTDEDHGILQSRAHLYHSMENFLNDCLIKS